MDEFAQMYMNALDTDAFYRDYDPLKTTLSYAIYRPARWFTDDPVAMLRAAKLIALALALGSVAWVSFIAQRLYQRTSAALISAIALLSSSNFIETGTNVRSDTCFLFSSLFGLGLLVWRRGPLVSALAGAAGGLAFLCSQKAVYFLGAVSLFALIDRRTHSSWRRTFVEGASYLAGALTVIVAYAASFEANVQRVLVGMFSGPVESRHMTVLATHFEGLSTFILSAIEYNAILYLVGLCGGAALLLRGDDRDRMAALVVCCATAVAATMLHPQPWPFLLASGHPFLALLVPAALWWVPRPHRVVLTLAVPLLLTVASSARSVALLGRANDFQLETVAKASALLDEDDAYFDGVGMLPHRRIAGAFPHWWWDAPSRAKLRAAGPPEDNAILRSILADKPKVWIVNYRLLGELDYLGEVLSNSTVRIDEVLGLSGTALTPGAPTRFVNLWPGAYAVFDEQGRRTEAALEVNGQGCATPCLLPAETLSLRVPGSGSNAFVLPADQASYGPLPHTGPVPHLYADVYGQ